MLTVWILVLWMANATGSTPVTLGAEPSQQLCGARLDDALRHAAERQILGGACVKAQVFVLGS